MGYFKQGRFMLLWGTVGREPSLKETKNGKLFCGFSVKYDRRHNEDGQMVSDYMNCTAWNETAKLVADDDVGIAKGDEVLIIGKFTEDTWRKEGEPYGDVRWKVEADIVLDMTSVFQIAQMVVSGGALELDEEEEPKSSFTETNEKTPFSDEMDDDDGDLPS